MERKKGVEVSSILHLALFTQILFIINFLLISNALHLQESSG